MIYQDLFIHLFFVSYFLLSLLSMNPSFPLRVQYPSTPVYVQVCRLLPYVRESLNLCNRCPRGLQVAFVSMRAQAASLNPLYSRASIPPVSDADHVPSDRVKLPDKIDLSLYETWAWMV
jgi:hypothetical protein